MSEILRDPFPDSTLALLRDSYGFVAQRCRRFHADRFEARIMLRRTICMQGRAAAELRLAMGRLLALPRSRSVMSPETGQIGVNARDQSASTRRIPVA